GSGNPSPATISGNLALNPFAATGPVTRIFTVNDGATGDDLVISAAISDGNGLFSSGITLSGLGTVQFAGSAANTYTGTTIVNSGTLELNKTPGVNALTGPLTIGDGGYGSGGQNSDVVRLLASNQLNAAVNVTINSTGLLDLNGFSDTVGNLAGSVGLTINGGNITTGAGTLTLVGDLTETTTNANNIQSPGTISGNLNLGSAARTFTINHFSGLPYDLIISANISGAAGVDLNKAGTGNLLLSGNNTYAGQTFVAAGEIAVGSNSALGTGSLYLSGGSLLADSGPQTISNQTFVSSFTLAGVNALTFSGPANLTGNATITVTNAMFATFSGGIGETLANLGLTKAGSGFLVLTGANTFDGTTTINDGWLVLQDGGTAVNASSFVVNSGGTLRIDNNSADNLANRLGPNAAITLAGGTLLYIGAGGAASTETIGSLTIASDAASTLISQVGAGSGSSVALTFGQLIRNELSFVQFVGAGTSLGASNQVAFIAAPTETGAGANAILPYATVTSSGGQVDLATLSGTSNALVAFSNYSTGNINSAAVGSDYLLDGNLSPSPQTLTSSRSFNAILVRGNGLALGGNSGTTLTVNSGEILSAAGASANTISVPTLAFGAVEDVLDASANLTISSTITGTSTVGIIKAGSGTLTLSGSSANTYTGQTIVTQG
ncbi:MAG TPA: autotransporter-associated beta strand repeat-containing protein, partial [Pirellulales bacterium]